MTTTAKSITTTTLLEQYRNSWIQIKEGKLVIPEKVPKEWLQFRAPNLPLIESEEIFKLFELEKIGECEYK